ncbi:MAG: protein kinase [Myxococcota bacterium]
MKVLNFGLAKLAAADTHASATMTARGVVMGTVGYMSPEQIAGGDVDSRSDLFAVGVMLAEVLTGRRPFQGETAQDVARAVLRDPWHLPYASSQARALDALLQRCLEKDARSRLASAEALRAELIPLLRACPTPLA